MALAILKIIAAVGTLLTGLVSMLMPRSIEGFTGLTASGPRGITEIRAILGALFVGLGASALLLRETSAYLMLGITYLCVAAVRTISMFLDKSVVRSNVISIIAEVAFGVILVL